MWNSIFKTTPCVLHANIYIITLAYNNFHIPQLSCEEVMKAYVDRSREVHKYINAATDERYDEALKEARAVDTMLAATTKTEEEIARDTPLLGVPFSCKEAIGVKGMSCSGRVNPEMVWAAEPYSLNYFEYFLHFFE